MPRLLIIVLGLLVGIAGAAALAVRLSATRDALLGQLRGPAIGVPAARLYPKDDPWRPYLASERVCPGGEDETRSPQAQADTMICLINYARDRAGLTALAVSPTLSESARLKGEDILRCGDFAHSPCGDDPGAGIRSLGYRGSFGENLYVADGALAAPRVALDQWLNSPDHRENLLRPQWRAQSVYVAKVARFREYRGGEVWVSQFADRSPQS